MIHQSISVKINLGFNILKFRLTNSKLVLRAHPRRRQQHIVNLVREQVPSIYPQNISYSHTRNDLKISFIIEQSLNSRSS